MRKDMCGMVYRGVCARLNGEPDSHGDILGPDFELPRNPVNVKHEFYERTNIGEAHIEKEGNDVVAYVRFFDPEVHSQEVVEQLYVVIGGSCSKREGNKITKWALKEVSTTLTPSDKTLTKLKINNRNGCCSYSGPPFKPCEYCGSRKSV